MTVLTPNLPELKRLNMWVQKQDQLEPGARIWEQGDWVEIREETPMCQTAYCVCGMAIVRAGHALSARPQTLYPFTQLILDGQPVGEDEIQRLGQEILGINWSTSQRLFCGSNLAFDIDTYICRVFEEAEVDYDSVEPAPDLEIEIKASEAAQQHSKFINALASK